MVCSIQGWHLRFFSQAFLCAIDSSSLTGGELLESDLRFPCVRIMKHMYQRKDAKDYGLQYYWNEKESSNCEFAFFLRNGQKLRHWKGKYGLGTEHYPSIIVIFSEIPYHQFFSQCVPPSLQHRESGTTETSGRWNVPWRKKPVEIKKWDIKKKAKDHMKWDSRSRVKRADFSNIYMDKRRLPWKRICTQ